MIHLLKKSLMENFIFCAVFLYYKEYMRVIRKEDMSNLKNA